MAQVTGRPTPPGGHTFASDIAKMDTTPHVLHTLPKRVVRPINYSPLGPSTLHVASPLKNQKVK